MNHTVVEVRKPFHLESIDLDKQQFHIIVVNGARAEQWIVDFPVNVHLEQIQAYAKSAPCHEMKFEEKDGQVQLGYGGTLPKYLCACDLWRTQPGYLPEYDRYPGR
jgi:hypothetical protein